MYSRDTFNIDSGLVQSFKLSRKAFEAALKETKSKILQIKNYR